MNKITTQLLLIISILILYGCMTMMPTAHEKFSPEKIQVVAKGSAITKSPGIIATPAISPDGKYQLKATSAGDIKIMLLDRTSEQVIYDRMSDDEFDKMDELVEKDTTGLSDDKAAANEYINQVSGRDAAAGAALQGMAAGMEQLEEWAEDQRYIIDMAWSPNNNRIAALIYSPMALKAIVYIINSNDYSKTVVKKFYVPGAHNDNVIYSCGVSWKNNNELVYSYFDGANNSEYYKLISKNIDNNQEEIVSENDIIKAYYSPTGENIAYFKPAGEYESKMVGDLSPLENYFSSLALFVGSKDFSGEYKLVDGIHTNKRVSWSKDGSKLAYVKDGEVKMSGTKDTLFYFDINSRVSTNICTGTFLNTPLFMNDTDIYMYMFDSHIFKAITN